MKCLQALRLYSRIQKDVTVAALGRRGVGMALSHAAPAIPGWAQSPAVQAWPLDCSQCSDLHIL